MSEITQNPLAPDAEEPEYSGPSTPAEPIDVVPIPPGEIQIPEPAPLAESGNPGSSSGTEAVYSEELIPGNRKRRRTGLWIFLGILAVLLLVGGGVAVWYSHLKSQEDALIRQTEAALESGDWQAAEQASNAALAIQPENLREHVSEAIVYRATAYYRLGQYDLALPDIQQTLATSPSRADMHRYLAEIYYQQGQVDLALREADLAVNGGEDFVLPDQIRLEQDLQANDHAAALTDANEVLKHEETALALRVLARAALLEADFKTAQKHLARSLDLDPKDVEALAMRVFLSNILDQVDQVKMGAEAAASAEPESAAAYWAQAIAALHIYDYDLAQDLIEKRSN